MPKPNRTEEALNAAHGALRGMMYRKFHYGKSIRIPLFTEHTRLYVLAEKHKIPVSLGARRYSSAIKAHLAQHPDTAAYKFGVIRVGRGEKEELVIRHASRLK